MLNSLWLSAGALPHTASWWGTYRATDRNLILMINIFDFLILNLNALSKTDLESGVNICWRILTKLLILSSLTPQFWILSSFQWINFSPAVCLGWLLWIFVCWPFSFIDEGTGGEGRIWIQRNYTAFLASYFVKHPRPSFFSFQYIYIYILKQSLENVSNAESFLLPSTSRQTWHALFSRNESLKFIIHTVPVPF